MPVGKYEQPEGSRVIGGYPGLLFAGVIAATAIGVRIIELRQRPDTPSVSSEPLGSAALAQTVQRPAETPAR